VGHNHKDPAVSVVMPVYNGESHLCEAIDSILGQSFVDFEFIIVDDGSTDSSARIVKAYRDPRIRLVQQENSGIAIALNKGIKLARGEYIARMDADDISLPGRLDCQYNYLMNHGETDILGGQAHIIDMHGEVIGDNIKPISQQVIKKAIEYACPLIHPTYMVRKSVYLELDGYRARFPPCEDYDFLLRALDSGKGIANLDKYLLYYRVDSHFPRPARDRYQMFMTRVALKLHRQRVRSGREDPGALASVSVAPVKCSQRFSLAYRCRNLLLLRAKHTKGINYLVLMLFVAMVSFADFELFCSSLRGGLYKKVCVEG
jgi:glycosyltransferase involved in cell wall biosynthesis